MRTLLTLAAVILLVDEPSWAQSFVGAPASYQYFRPPSLYSAPPVRTKRRAPPQQTKVSIPQPENTTIGEEYAKGDIVIVNHERSLYFVEGPGHAIRYPVAIGTLDDQWDGCKRSRPSAKIRGGFLPKIFSGKWECRLWSLPDLKTRSGRGHFT